MNIVQSIKRVSVTPPGAIVDAASYTTAIIDTLGYHKLAVTVYLGATDIAMAALKLQESDASNMGSATDITGCVFGTSTNPDTGTTSALPTADDDGKFFTFFVDLNGRKRYIDLVATAGDGSAGTYLTAWADLFVGNDNPENATERGLAANLIA
ncbi:MAG: hypothetical protein IPH49_15765 [Ignavibacteria bacterium]|nr:hypothetical protein [Ignavibacteria bacterium]